MKKETLTKILEKQKVKSQNGRYSIPDNEVVTLMIGQAALTTLNNIVELVLEADYLAVKSKKKVTTYVEYDFVRTVSFDLKENADRSAGFF